jgi:hypothetical protein
MTEENESASPEIDGAMTKLERRLKALEKSLAEIAKVCVEVGAAGEGERKWYVLKHDGVHHLVDNYAVRAYCGWPIHPDSEMIDPPKNYNELAEIGTHFCQRCADLRRTETEIKRKGIQ